jgi:hypothetical protein
MIRRLERLLRIKENGARQMAAIAKAAGHAKRRDLRSAEVGE